MIVRAPQNDLWCLLIRRAKNQNKSLYTQIRVSSEQKLSRKSAKSFERISQTFLRKFAFFRENELHEIM